jgi:hypothetical protein
MSLSLVGMGGTKEREKHGGSGALAFAAIGLLVILPLLYLLSSGPVGLLVSWGYLSPQAFWTIYRPVQWLSKLDCAREFFVWYLRYWIALFGPA